MKLTVENTAKIVEIESATGRIPARLWQGKTESGIEVTVFVTRVMIHKRDDSAEFERELQEVAPSSEAVLLVPSRMIL